MSENGSTPPAEETPVIIETQQVQELFEYAVKALEVLRAQERDLAIQIERQVGIISGFEMLLKGKAAETIKQIREAVEKDNQKKP